MVDIYITFYIKPVSPFFATAGKRKIYDNYDDANY